MKTKTSVFALTILLCLCTFQARASDSESKAGIRTRVATMTEAQKEERLHAISARVEEIRRMDFSILSRSERKELKNELKAMKYEGERMHSRRVIFTAGAIVIVIIAIILIF